MNITPKVCPAVKILLVDESDRTFLFKGRDRKNKSDVYWCPVGGGMEPGETPEEAIRREVILTWNGSLIYSKEVWFFSEVDHFQVDISGFSELLAPLLEVRFPETPLELIHEDSLGGTS